MLFYTNAFLKALPKRVCIAVQEVWFKSAEPQQWLVTSAFVTS